MTKLDDYRVVARSLKRELDSYRLAFKTLQAKDVMERLRERGENAHSKGKDVCDKLESALLQEGLITFPSLQDASETDGYVRLIRSGTVLAGILNALRYPGEGSDEELSLLLGKVKRQSASAE
jgi:hypothetical protein